MPKTNFRLYNVTQQLLRCTLMYFFPDILEIDSFIKNPESDEVTDLILKRHSSNGQWKAISYLLIGNVIGADSKLAGSFSKCNCSSLSVLKMFKETSETQKRVWANKLAIKLLQNGASFQEFENGMDEHVIHFGVKIALQTGIITAINYFYITRFPFEFVNIFGPISYFLLVTFV